MINELKIYCSGETNPYYNLSTEEFLLNGVKEGQCILYLWQNRHTVVIGRNQNALSECKADKLKADGGFLARRLSGGGCVYHDLGNLNFTFLVKESDYNVDRQLSVISHALKAFGLNAEKSGRNDICIDGKKFSGNAFYKHLGNCYHHGTILVDVDMGKMTEYLHVSAEKLKSNGVSSVRSRVVNLKELNEGITIDNMKEAMQASFGEVYGNSPSQISLDDFESQKAIKALFDKYASNEWLYGKHMKADYTVKEKFAWGEISICLKINGNTIDEVQVFSDAMDERVAEVVEGCLRGYSFNREAVEKALLTARGNLEEYILSDIISLMGKQEIWK